MTDVLTRLRQKSWCGPLHTEAADEIEQLRAENANLRRWKALDKPITAAMEIANSHIAQMRAAIATEARRYASHYPEASDGRNTFILLAEWIETRAHSSGMRTGGEP